MPADQQTPGEEQEARVRSRLVAEGYEQAYGVTDDEIRRNLSIRGKCADFVGYHPQLNRWLIAESKGSNIDIAYAQLMNTTKALLAREPSAKGKLDLHIYTSSENYKIMLEDARGLGGNLLGDGYLGFFGEDQAWHDAEIEGIKIKVLQEQAT